MRVISMLAIIISLLQSWTQPFAQVQRSYAVNARSLLLNSSTDWGSQSGNSWLGLLAVIALQVRMLARLHPADALRR